MIRGLPHLHAIAMPPMILAGISFRECAPASRAEGGRMQAQMSGNVSTDTVSADFGTRLVAWLIDAVIVGVPVFILAVILPLPLVYLVALIAGVGYQVYFWTTTGQTIGKKAMGLKVVSAETGELLDYGGAAIRYVGYIVSGIPFYLGYLWMIWDPQHDGWHDKIAKTKVIKVQ
jgi:uncharacterized RDD family membrane protein YckC